MWLVSRASSPTLPSSGSAPSTAAPTASPNHRSRRNDSRDPAKSFAAAIRHGLERCSDGLRYTRCYLEAWNWRSAGGVVAADSDDLAYWDHERGATCCVRVRWDERVHR